MSDIQSSDPGMGTMVLRGLMKLTMRISTFAFGLTALVATILYIKQDDMLYFPEISGLPRRPDDNPSGYRSPEEHQVPFEDLYIECEDGVIIHSWLLLRTNTEKNMFPTIIFFHGNAGNIGLRLPNAIQMVCHSVL